MAATATVVKVSSSQWIQTISHNLVPQLLRGLKQAWSKSALFLRIPRYRTCEQPLQERANLLPWESCRLPLLAFLVFLAKLRLRRRGVCPLGRDQRRNFLGIVGTQSHPFVDRPDSRSYVCGIVKEDAKNASLEI